MAGRAGSLRSGATSWREGIPRRPWRAGSGATTVQVLTAAAALLVALAMVLAMMMVPALKAQGAVANRPLAAWQVMALNVGAFGRHWWWVVLIALVVALVTAGMAGKSDGTEQKNSE